MENLEYISLTVLTVLEFFIGIAFLNLCRKAKESCISFIMFFCGMTIMSSEVIPAFYCIITDVPQYFPLLRKWSWPFGQMLSLLYWGGLYLTLKTNKNIQIYMLDKISKYCPLKLVYCILIIGIVLSIIGIQSKPIEEIQAGYTAANWIIKHEYDPTNISLFSGIIRPFGRLFYPFYFILLYLLLTKIKQHIRVRYIIIISFIFCGIIIKLISDLLMGGRGTILEIGFMTLVVLWLSFNKKIALNIFGVILIVALFLSPIILSYRNDTTNYIKATSEEKIFNIQQIISDESKLVLWFSEIGRVIERFDGVPNGGNLSLYSLEKGNVYFTPYIGSLVSFIPRIVWNDKPYPKSGDGRVTGVPEWMSGQVSDRPWLCTSVSIASIAFWHFNFPGILILFSVHGLLLRQIAAIGDKLKRYELFLFLWFLLNPLLSIDYIIFNFMQSILPLFVISIPLKLFITDNK